MLRPSISIDSITETQQEEKEEVGASLFRQDLFFGRLLPFQTTTECLYVAVRPSIVVNSDNFYQSSLLWLLQQQQQQQQQLLLYDTKNGCFFQCRRGCFHFHLFGIGCHSSSSQGHFETTKTKVVVVIATQEQPAALSMEETTRRRRLYGHGC
jgi:hypothetical protein